MQRSEPKKDTPAVLFENVGLFFPRKPKLFNRKDLTDGHWALTDVSFKINHGDVLGVIGNNGAGKSTTLSLIGGIIRQTKGRVDTYGNRAAVLSINSGYVGSLDGRKNIMLLGLSLGVHKRVILEAMNDIIAFSELGEFIDEPVETYSSGMKARLGFFFFFMLEPEILLVDELLGVGDRNFKKKSSAVMKQKFAGHSTAVLVSHSEGTIRDLTNKALWIDKGRGMAFGESHHVVKEYIAFCETKARR